MSAKDVLIGRLRPCLGVLLVLLVVPAPAPPPPTGSLDRWTVELIPDEPVEGRFVQMVVREEGVATLVRVTGALAGQAVRFESDGEGRWNALAAIPVDAPDTLSLALEALDRQSRRSTRIVPVRVRRGAFDVEQLRVDPRFATPPDSALAARIAAEYARAMRISDEALSSPRLWEGAFTRPRPTRITSPFGTGRKFNGEIRSRHLGTDLAGATGAPVLAPNRAAVALVDSTWYGGNVVYLNHGAGVVTAYLHLSRILVAEGDTVETGTPIGRVGATGRVTGPHLHWIARYGRVTVDPLSLDALDLTAFGPHRTR